MPLLNSSVGEDYCVFLLFFFFFSFAAWQHFAAAVCEFLFSTG